MERLIFYFLFLLIIISLFSGCKKDETGTNPGDSTQDEEQIKALLTGWEAAIKVKNISVAMSFVSNNYLQDGETKSDVDSMLNKNLANDSVINVTISNIVINVLGNSATVSAHIKFELQSDTFEDDVSPQSPFIFTYWHKEAGGWKMFGNQQRYRVNVFSGHWQNGYYAELYVNDPHKRAISVTATGPGITGTMNLEYRSGDGISSPSWWHTNNPFLGLSVPTTAQTFSFTITDSSGTYNYSKTITGYVVAFATNLSPSGNVGGTVTFSWTGIANADGYSVELSDNNNIRIWNAYSLPSTQTSVVYDGPALTISQTYNYSIVSHIETGGVSNSSFASGQFKYTGGGY
jgi:hypothetical protein